MCTPLAKLAIGLSATMATGFYYLAAAPPASAVDVCGPGNYSSACVPDNTPSPGAASLSRDPEPASAAIPEPVLDSPAVESPAPLVPEALQSPVVSPVVPPVPEAVVPPVPEAIPSPILPEAVVPPVPEAIPSPILPLPAPVPTTPQTLPDIYTNAPAVRSTAIPEPGTAIALLLTGAGMIFGGIKRNKQVGQQR